MSKPLVVFIGGGESSEHEISIRSLYSVFNNFQSKIWRKAIVIIDKRGYWFFAYQFNDLLEKRKKQYFLKKNKKEEIVLIKRGGKTVVYSLERNKILDNVGMVFPLTHGTFGEDGSLQGYLELLNVPYVGANVLSSALGMDKEFFKKILKEAKIPVIPSLTLNYTDTSKERREKIEQAITKFGFPLFVKPASLGSSIGVSKVFEKPSLKQAINKAFDYDNKVLLEKFIKGREVECAVLGNENPRSSLVGEIQPQEEFYSYSAKYLNPAGAKLLAPTNLSCQTVKKIQKIALEVYRALGVTGMARVDFFLQANGRVITSEINTIPGFTEISMYPKLWQASGLPYPKLLEKLVSLALETYKAKKRLRRSY